MHIQVLIQYSIHLLFNHCMSNAINNGFEYTFVKASMTLVIVWGLSIATSVVFAQEGICKLQEYPRPADYTGDKYETEVFQTNNNITFCDQQACRGISNEELNACNDGSFPSFDEYLRLLKYTLKSKSDCKLTGDPDACQAVDANGNPAHDGDKCCRTYFGVVPPGSTNRFRRNALGNWCFITQTFSIGECRDSSQGRCRVCQNQTSLQYLDAYCGNGLNLLNKVYFRGR
ncbi:uncharacterized protein LOC128224083 isoform X2 [Mya arenaria]|uniref:uncharacterized protein LOC128224083 isoform X2 n=1 Tax=Mya arenaria TaxID=6604 RepID=UPI0022DFC347|nr:uncharacterized protein LOC128224083 isoform X2 [Mya arenaria]